ncbi:MULTISPECIES: SurA N-terminal domain-containing protein [unclassified Variovorax]|jgi:peptidyl-prolyl cis-trans isomerase D|uniref:SurA N-terminal domain-containing protein n=1 Tax=unclassified Variovorax TaxID=663243 RepID=UPI0008BF1050|nr:MULTISPECIES: SurA N-terminal domain-containing protein [unclassified Variovorax]SEJ29727.1 peptidyl-prolyl cis-trans isomerase D [Variovorax sp. OK202]SFC23711.1 peptidyl-prolyl cis-trans isomerase D [Variovorax sp. OK212]
MFDFFRKYNKIVMIFLFLLIIPSFVLFGVERYQGSGGDEKVARIQGHDITRPEWDQQHRVETDRIRQQSPNVDPTVLDSDALRYATLERMVRDRVLAAAAAKTNMTVSEDRLARMFAQDPGLAAFRTPDGKFDRDAFMRVTGRTPEQYEASVRSDMTTQQVLLGVSGTAFTPPALASTTINAFYDSREIQVARFAPDSFASKVAVSDADIESYYKDHMAQFQAPERADIEYLVLDIEAAKKNIVLSDADLQTYYKDNTARFGTKEERRASHILINAPASMPAADREKAKAKAEQLLAEVKKAPNTFADVARKNSDDDLTAKNGGQFDMGPKGSLVAKPLDDAVFALKKGEISSLIETEFGFHIVQLNDIKPAQVTPFEQVRATIENEARAQQATQEFAKAAEVFTDAVYQSPDSLKPAAEKLKLTIQTAKNVARTAASGAAGALASRNFLSALFAPDSLERKQNTEAIEVGSSQLAAGRVTQYTPAHAVPLADVKDKIRAQLVTERAAVLAKTEGEAKLAAWTAKADGATFGAPVTVSRREAQSQPLPVIDAALRADASKLPALVGVDLGAQGYVVVRVTKVVPRTPPAPELAKQEQAQVGQSIAAAEDAAYYNLLKERFKAEILVPKPADTLPVAGR